MHNAAVLAMQMSAGANLLLLALLSLAVGVIGHVSFNPETFAEGGLIDDVDVTIQTALFAIWDYGKNDPSIQTTALGLELVDSEGKVHIQYFSASDPQYFVPSEDGTQLVPVADKTALSGSSNFAKFMQSLVNAGFPADKLNGDSIKVLEGLVCHINRVAQPKRSGLINKGGGGANDREKTVITVTKIIKLPWEGTNTAAKTGLGAKPVNKLASVGVNKAVAPKPAGAPAQAQAHAAPSNGAATVDADVDSKCTEVLLTILGEEGAVPKGQIVGKAFKLLGTDPLKPKVVKRIFSDEFLSSGGDGAWTYDGANVSLAG